MLAHISFPAKNSHDTAKFFAAIIDGQAFDFPVVEGAAIAVAKDGSGTAIEVYPQPMMHHPGEGKVDPNYIANSPQTMPWETQIYAEANYGGPSTFHLALTTQLNESEVIALAEAHGWRYLACERAGVFGVIEVWVDNTYLVEVLTTEQAARYKAFMTVEGCAAMFGKTRS
jgi:hypothetical protein